MINFGGKKITAQVNNVAHGPLFNHKCSHKYFVIFDRLSTIQPHQSATLPRVAHDPNMHQNVSIDIRITSYYW